MSGDEKREQLGDPRVRAFGVTARHAREEAGLTQRAASRALGWPNGKLSRVESGERSKVPSRDEVAQLDALYETGTKLKGIAGYMPGRVSEDLDAAMREVVQHHMEALYRDFRRIVDDTDE